MNRVTPDIAIKILEDKIKTMEDGAISSNYGIDKDVFWLAIDAMRQIKNNS